MPALPSAHSSPSSKEGAGSFDSSASFDRFLDKVDDLPEPSESKTSAMRLASAPLTAEQLALMASMVMPNSTLVPPLPTPPLPETTDASSFNLMGSDGRSIPELLVNGAKVLEYQAAPPSTEGRPAPAPAVAGSAAFSRAWPTVQPLADLETEAGPQLTSPGDSDLSEEHNPVTSAQIPADGAASPTIGNARDAWAMRFRENPIAVPSQASVQTSPFGATPTDPAAAWAASAVTPPQGDGQILQAGNSPMDTAIPSFTAVNAAAQGVAENLPKGKQTPNDRPEKFAGITSKALSIGGVSTELGGKNRVLSVDSEQVDQTDNDIGTVAANSERTMTRDPYIFPAASGQREANSLGGLMGSGMGTTIDELKTVSPSQATDLVHEIREIADGLWAVERNSVEVKFNFGEQERLSVRVEYRDGTVRATFRTDSPDVRDAIAREWQAQAGAAEQRPYRVAEPVFAGGASSEFSPGGDASRQQRSPEQQQSTPFERFTTAQPSRSAPSTTASSPVPLVSPQETTGRLHARV